MLCFRSPRQTFPASASKTVQRSLGMPLLTYDGSLSASPKDLFPSRGFKGSFITAGFPAQLSHLGSEVFHGLVKDFRFSSPAFHWFERFFIDGLIDSFSTIFRFSSSGSR